MRMTRPGKPSSETSMFEPRPMAAQGSPWALAQAKASTTSSTVVGSMKKRASPPTCQWVKPDSLTPVRTPAGAARFDVSMAMTRSSALQAVWTFMFQRASSAWSRGAPTVWMSPAPSRITRSPGWATPARCAAAFASVGAWVTGTPGS
ncbi:hypothetical protein D3C72_543530 [compost metagenome]